MLDLGIKGNVAFLGAPTYYDNMGKETYETHLCAIDFDDLIERLCLSAMKDT